MNLPSSLAFPSKLFQSRTGILVLALVAVLLSGAAYFFLAFRPLRPTRMPTPATSPAAQAPVRVKPAPPPIVYGPPAPDWVPRDPVPGAEKAGAAGAVAGASGAGAGAAGAAGAAAVRTPAGAVPLAARVPGAAIPAPGATTSAAIGEAPRSLEGSALFARDQYVYTSGGRRDPFASLLAGKFLSQSGDGSLVDVGDIHLVGIMWGSSDKFALVEDSRGRGYVLRVGDPVVNGYISGISRSELQIVQNAFGESQSMAIKLKPKEGDQNATRN